MKTEKTKEKTKEPTIDTSKEKALNQALRVLEKDGVKPISFTEDTNIEIISTGIMALDTAIRKGGYPRGRIVEMYGPESGGKSSLSLISAGNIQKKGGTAVYVDAENCFEPKWASKLGVDVNKLKIFQPQTGEEGFEIIEKLASSCAIDLIIVDSIAALVPKAILEGTMEDKHIGVHARLISQGLMKINSAVSNSKTVIIFVNQLREKVGVMFGNPETTPGGRALKFYASLRIRVSKVKSTIEKALGHKIRVVIQKNKIAAPYGEGYFDLYYESGVDQIGGLVETAVNSGIVQLEGKTYSFGDKTCVGMARFKDMVKEDKKLQNDIIGKLKQKI